jgi:hypothetical protein
MKKKGGERQEQTLQVGFEPKTRIRGARSHQQTEIIIVQDGRRQTLCLRRRRRRGRGRGG